MDFKQNDISKKFIREAEELVNAGIEPTFKAIADKLKWHNNSLSLVVNGKRNIPPGIYKKFADLYRPVEINREGRIYEIALQNQAIQRVILRAIAELLSKQRNESVTKTLGDLEAAARAEILTVSGR